MNATEYKGFVGYKFTKIHEILDENPEMKMMIKDPSYGLVDLNEAEVIVVDDIKVKTILTIRSHYDKEKKQPYEYMTTENEKQTWVENRDVVKREKALVIFG